MEIQAEIRSGRAKHKSNALDLFPAEVLGVVVLILLNECSIYTISNSADSLLHQAVDSLSIFSFKGI